MRAPRGIAAGGDWLGLVFFAVAYPVIASHRRDRVVGRLGGARCSSGEVGDGTTCAGRTPSVPLSPNWRTGGLAPKREIVASTRKKLLRTTTTTSPCSTASGITSPMPAHVRSVAASS